VLRALNKENGPRRQARTSYGIWRSEEYGAFPEHAEAKKSYDKHDGLEYAAGTIDWVLKLVFLSFQTPHLLRTHLNFSRTDLNFSRTHWNSSRPHLSPTPTHLTSPPRLFFHSANISLPL
jgi:hypothetical protein